VIVPDASVILELLLQTPEADRIESRLLGKGESLHVPELLDVEVAQVLRRYEARGELTARRGREALEVLSRFPLQRYAHTALLPRVWALRTNLTAYDAAYVALAEGLGATLITRDRRLKSAPHRAATEVL
jgi:predicted nucleic acid-binding protein